MGWLLFGLTIRLTVGPGCDFDHAEVTMVPPSALRVVQTETCGLVTCWTRWLEFEGKRVRESRACEDTSLGGYSSDRLTIVPPGGP